MPDGTMTPENSYYKFKIGPTKQDIDKFKIGPSQKDIDKFVSLKEAPVNFADDDPDKEARDRADFERSREGSDYDKGRTIEAIIARHPDPETVRYSLRDLQLNEETFNTNGEPDNRWEVSHRFRVLADRALVLKMPTKDLVKRNLIEPLDNEELDQIRKQRGKTIPVNLNENLLAKSKYVEGFGFENYSVSTPSLESFEIDEEGNIQNKRFKLVPQTYVYLGTETERAKRSSDFDLLKDEISARQLMMQIWGHHTTYYYALNKLAEGHYFGTTLSSEGLGILFNLKSQEGSINKTITNIELRSLGDKVETAMRLYYVAALSEKPERFKKELIESPGWKQFLFPNGTAPSVIKDWIGEPDRWEKEVSVGGHRKPEDKDNNIDSTTNQERKAGLRGKLTQMNIFSSSDTFVEGNLNNAIEEFISGGESASHVDRVEAETARRIGNRMFRLFLLADQEGLELLEDKPKGNIMDPFDGIKIVFENAPGASDFGKLTHPPEYAGKSRGKQRDYMPPVGFLHAREYYKRFMVDFLRHASIKTEVEIKEGGNKKFIYEDRSLMERWWGYKNETINNKEYLEEKAVRLGDLPWVKLMDPIHISPIEASMLSLPVGGVHHEAFKSLWLSGFMAGGEGRAHAIISETNHNPKNFLDLHWWNKFWKMLDVGIRPSVALEGRFRGLDDTEIKNITKEHKVKIVENFIMGLQSLPQWDEWGREEIRILEKRKKESKEPQLIDLIFQTANQALEGSGVKVTKPTYYGDLLRR